MAYEWKITSFFAYICQNHGALADYNIFYFQLKAYNVYQLFGNDGLSHEFFGITKIYQNTLGHEVLKSMALFFKAIQKHDLKAQSYIFRVIQNTCLVKVKRTDAKNEI